LAIVGAPSAGVHPATPALLIKILTSPHLAAAEVMCSAL
jgi:hypothetical protein